jgi:hypothetical protein
MGNHPWDRPPFPKKGNKSNGVLFASIGRTLNAWEEVEIAMAHLYAAIVTGDRFDQAANHAYGKEANFNQRLADLQEVAEKRFITEHSQPIEGEFARLMRIAVGYSARRNDMAHGHALYLHWVIDPASRITLLDFEADLSWCWVPPHFRANKFTARNVPAYVLTSREINAFGLVFWDIARAVSNLSLWLLRFPPSRGIRPRPGALPYKIQVPRIR